MRKKHIAGEQGIAMVAVLVMSAITLAVMGGLVYMVTTSTKVSGGAKRYSTALEAAQGCIPLAGLVIEAGGDPNVANVNYIQNISPACLTIKRREATTDWENSCDNTNVDIDTANAATYDFSFDIGDFDNINADYYRCYVKIINTVSGNSMAMATPGDGTPRIWGRATGTTGEADEGLGVSMPYIYSIEIASRPLNNPDALKSQVALLYQF